MVHNVTKSQIEAMFSETDHRVNTPNILINNPNNEQEHTPSWFVDDMKQGGNSQYTKRQSRAAVQRDLNKLEELA